MGGWALFMFVGLFFSGRGQTFEEAMQLTCEAAQVHQDKDIDVRLKYAFKDLEPKVTNQEVIDLWMALETASGDERLALLDAAAKRAGIARCRIRDVFKELGEAAKRSAVVHEASLAALIAVEWQLPRRVEDDQQRVRGE